MKHVRIVLLSTLLLLPAARVWAQAYDAAGPRELYHAEVCNQGRITVDVAVAYKDFGFDEFWIVDYWYPVAPGKCALVFSHFYAPNNAFSFQSFPLYLAYAFTDSSGVWGAANVKPARDTAASRVHLCLGKSSGKYRVDGKSPQAKCPKGLPFPASIVWEPTRGVYSREFGGYPPPKRFTVALGPNDRAIPLGPQASTTPAPQGPDTSEEFLKLLRVALNALHYSEEPPPGPGGYVQLKHGYRWVFACVGRAVVAKESWSNPQTARAKTLTNAIRKFLESHGKGTIRFRVKELNGVLVVEQIGGKAGDCVDRRAADGEYEFVFQSPEAGAVIGAAPAPKPAPKAAPEPTPGFGDLMGPGGFITPLPPK